MYKLVLLAALLAVSNAGIIAAPAAVSYTPAAVTSQSANILRSYGNLGQVSTYTKTVDTPYSSVSKSDVRVSNPGYATYAAPAVAAYHAPAPVIASAYHAPVVSAAPAYHAPIVAAAPAYHAPVVAAAPAVTAYHTPVVAKTPVIAPGALGVAYSAAPAVAHYTFDGFGTHLAY